MLKKWGNCDADLHYIIGMSSKAHKKIVTISVLGSLYFKPLDPLWKVKEDFRKFTVKCDFLTLVVAPCHFSGLQKMATNLGLDSGKQNKTGSTYWEFVVFIHKVIFSFCISHNYVVFFAIIISVHTGLEFSSISDSDQVTFLILLSSSLKSSYI